MLPILNSFVYMAPMKYTSGTNSMHTKLLVIVTIKTVKMIHYIKMVIITTFTGDGHYKSHHHIVSQVQSSDAHYYCSEHH